VSVDSTGRQANRGSYGPSISADGVVVAFSSQATNIVPGDSNGMMDVFVHIRDGHEQPPPPDTCMITGTPGDDVLTGTTGADVICGLDGNDVIAGRSGDDVEGRVEQVRGGHSNDRLVGDFANNLLSGGAGDDELIGASGEDELSGGDGADRLDAVWQDDESIDRLRCGGVLDTALREPEDLVSSSCETR
jgi:Ca2+-binding RTX toxin-like protein